jgi:FKBP12-rapamycin complex-associated protein
MNSLEQALTIPDLPEISQTILNLAEFMEHCDKGPLPLDPVLLGEQAVKCRAYAKALHYKVSILLSSNFAKWDNFFGHSGAEE